MPSFRQGDIMDLKHNQVKLDSHVFIKYVNLIEQKASSDNTDSDVLDEELGREGLLNMLKQIQSELDGMQDKQEFFISSHDSKPPFAGLNHLLAVATHEQLEDLFNILSRIKNVDPIDFIQCFSLFSFLAGSLVHLRENHSQTLSWDTIVHYLSYDNIVKLTAQSFYLPEKIKTLGLTYLNSLKGVDVYNYYPNNTVLASHNYWAEQVKNMFVFEKTSLILQNTDLTELIHDILNYSHNMQRENYLPVLIGSIKYPNELSNDKQIEIAQALSEHQKNHEFPYQIYYGITEGLFSRNQQAFFKAVDAYISYYFFKEQRDLNATLSLQDKVELFYSDYFRGFFTELFKISYSTFIDLLFHYYDKEIFFEFMKRYNIPFNIPLRITLENNDNHYLSLMEYALWTGHIQIMNDLIDSGEDIHTPFNAKIMEADRVFHYRSDPMADLSIFSAHDLLYLIEKEVINEEHTYYLEMDSVVEKISIFFYLLSVRNYHAFYKLYYKIKNRNPHFDLREVKTGTTGTDLVYAYFSYLLKNSDNIIFDDALLDIFVEAGFDLFYSNKQGQSSFSRMSGFSVPHIIQLLDKLDVLIPQSYKQSLAQPKVLLEPQTVLEEINDMALNNNETQVIEWFNPKKLEEHLKKNSKEKEALNADYIKQMLSDNNHLKTNLILNDYQFFDTLQEEFPNFNEVIRFYKGQFKLKKLTGKKHIQPVLLLGEPGIGKTYFAKKLSQYLKTGYTFLDMGSITANWILSGNNGTWKNAKQGKILEAIMNSSTINPVILMDEIEKARGGDFDPTLVLYQLLEEINACEFTDEFIDFSFDASGIIYIACANSFGHMSEALISRFKVFEVPSPNSEQLEYIVANIYRDAIKDAKIFEPVLDKNIIHKLKGYSLRNVKNMIDHAISTALLDLSDEEAFERIKTQQLIELSASYFVAPLQKNALGFN
jgi:MoxR-like ATPase